MKGKAQTCEICGETIDVTACNETRGIFTLMEDSDETEPKNTRMQLCGSCALEVSIFIHSKALERIQ
jgi:hypothetical protein